MRILATSVPNQGHFYPMVPLLWALRNAGHEVLIATADQFTAVAAGTGLAVASLGTESAGIDKPGGGAAVQHAGVESLVEHVTEFYVPLGERHTPAMVRLAEAWRPDLLVHTGWEYAGPVAAARLGIPAVLHGWGLAAPAELDAPIARALEPLHRAWGPAGGVPEPWREIDVCPPSLQVRSGDRPLVRFGWAPYSGSGVVPPWLLGAPERRRICVTLGNVPIMGDHATVLASVLDGVRELDAEVVIAGSARLAYDGLPDGVRVLTGLPLSAILPSCDLVVHHGGAGSAFAALALGLPSLALPQMCVQYQHADRIAEVGAGLCLHPEQVTADSVTKALRTLDEVASYRATARGLQRELAEQPPAGEAVAQLEAAR